MTQRAKQIGNTPLVDSSCDVSSLVPGITYRQWLIGQIASNPIIGDCVADEIAIGIIQTADIILEQLASEEK